MREHMGLYRGKEINTELWMRGYYVCLHDSKGNVSHRIYNAYAETDCGDYYPDWFEVDPDTVGECCGGLRDKNGKLIFEGDIIKYHEPFVMKSTGVVCFGENQWNSSMNVGFYMKWVIAELPAILRTDLGFWCHEREVEIIGNIHDNPELLKGGEQ